MPSVAALGPEQLLVGSDVDALLQVNALLQADSRFIQCGFPTPAHVGSDSRIAVFIIFTCAFCVCSSGMRVWIFEKGDSCALGW